MLCTLLTIYCLVGLLQISLELCSSRYPYNLKFYRIQDASSQRIKKWYSCAPITETQFKIQSVTNSEIMILDIFCGGLVYYFALFFRKPRDLF